MFGNKEELMCLNNRMDNYNDELKYLNGELKNINEEIFENLEQLKKNETDHIIQLDQKDKDVRELNVRIQQLKTELNNKEKKIKTLKEQLKQQESVNEKYVKDYRDILAKNQVYKDAYIDTKEQMRTETGLANKLTESNLEKDKTIASLKAVLDAVVRQNFDKEHIEFAAIKTYRGGWQYLYHNGKIYNVIDAEHVSIDSYAGENVKVSVDQ